jgi:predicted permease
MLAIYARLKPGTTIDAARAGTQMAAERFDALQPQPFKYANNVSLKPLAGFARLSSEPSMMTIGIFFLVLLAVVGLVLLIACVNVAGLLLARASARRREFAIRLALGASRGRLLQQLLVESLLLALAGAAFGLALSQATAIMLASVHLPLPLPIQLTIEPDWRVAAYAALLTLVAAVASGLLPAWQTVKESIAPDLARTRRLRLRRLLVVGQVAVSVVVLATAFLFLRNLMASSAISPGFDVVHTLRAQINLSSDYKTSAQIAGYVDRTLPALQALPGIEAAAAARIVPFTDQTRFGSDVTFADGQTVNASFHWNAVTPDYFRVMDIPVRQGRAFAAADGHGEKVAVVNREFVRRYLGDRPPVGLTFQWGGDTKVLFRIVGVVEGTKTMTVGEDDQPQLYEPLAQITNERRRLQFVLRSATPPALQLGPVRQALRRVDPATAAEVSTLYSSIGLAFLPSRVGAVLLGSIGVLGLTLAAVGLYGMMAFSVARRIQEIGVRLALGATEHDIARMVLGESARLVAIGSLIGLALALLVMRPLAMFLVAGLSPADPASLGAVVVVLALTGLAASWGPVRRASSVDPIAALRYE